ncbi:hypothetical protein [Aneurinibacillus terranovensis]|uniref:hypothetical protein n=1 Tax=Aneurinibacillus terranovensis TaxID=278991 RepID=UPI000429D230|nr:hypothetical protein [Aneurinibacillus terranovensis]
MGKKNKKSHDKNLQNVLEDLEVNPVSSFYAQQLQQDKNDRRHQGAGLEILVPWFGLHRLPRGGKECASGR